VFTEGWISDRAGQGELNWKSERQEGVEGDSETPSSPDVFFPN
jgi:hypothetical protein